MSDSDSDSDSEGGLYYNCPKFTPPPQRPQNFESKFTPPPQRPQNFESKATPSPQRPPHFESEGSSSPNLRPIPPPRRRSNTAGRDTIVSSSAAPDSPVSEDGHGRVKQTRNYEMHSLRNNPGVDPDAPYQDSNSNGLMDDLRNYSWYWGDISRGDAEQMLKDYPDGSFLVRDSTTSGDYTLTVRKAGQSKCLKVYQKDGRFGLKVNEYTFSSLLALIEHYSHHTLADFNRRLDTRLVSCPSKKTGKKSGNQYESLSTLADIGRQLQKAKQQYIKLKEQQLKSSKVLDMTQIKERAYMTAKAMFSELLAPTPSKSDDFVLEEEMSPERKQMLEENKKLAMERYRSIESKAKISNQEVEDMESNCNNATIAINDHVEVLRDAEENCAIIRKQLLEDGAKRELVECLVEECPAPLPDRTLWMVNCTRDEAIEYLHREPAGTFLIRPKMDDQEKPYALSIVSGHEDGSTAVKHCVIHHPAGRGYGFREDGAVFESIDELVSKHGKTSIKVYFAHMDTCLDHPIYGERPRSLGDDLACAEMILTVSVAPFNT